MASSIEIQEPIFADRQVIKAKNTKKILEKEAENKALVKIITGRETKLVSVILFKMAFTVSELVCTLTTEFKTELNPKVSINS